MSTPGKLIGMAAQLYSARDAARQMLGDGYPAFVAELGRNLQRAAEISNRTLLSVAISAAREAEGTDAIFLLAAAVEHIEPEGSTNG